MSPNASHNAVPIIDAVYPTGAEGLANVEMVLSAKTQFALKPAPLIAKAAALNVAPFAMRFAESASPMNAVTTDAASALLFVVREVADKTMDAEKFANATIAEMEL